MNKPRIILFLLIASIMASISLCAGESPQSMGDALPKVLIIGDSISIGYTPHVKKMLGNTVLLKHNPGNAEHTGTGLNKLDAWIRDEKWDVIHFNWGLWDLCYRHPQSKVQGHRDKVNGTLTTAIDQYGESLAKLVTRLKKTNATLIWANTTVIPDGEAGRIVGDAVKYNAVAIAIMKREGIQINDIYGLTKGFSASLFKAPGNVHFTSEGYRMIADQVTAKIREALDARSKNLPYPPSPIIRSITWAPVDTIQSKAEGGDNWPVTWADDDAIYTTWGDGWGFEPKTLKKLSLGFARVSGAPELFKGINVRSPAEQLGQGRYGKKSWGLLSVEGTLYMFLGHADRKGGQSQLAWSRDHARTWEFAEWKFSQFGLMGFINYGKDYEGARDNFVYAYSHNGSMADTPTDNFILMRVPKDQITNRKAWGFFERLDDVGDSIWTGDIKRRGAIFENKDSCLRSAMTYNAPLRRYLWWQQLPAPRESTDRGDTRFEGGFAIYDAPEPWGPWTTAFYTKHWDVGPGEHGDFPVKWMSEDGKQIYLVFSGDDAFCVRKATITLAEE